MPPGRGRPPKVKPQTIPSMEISISLISSLSPQTTIPSMEISLSSLTLEDTTSPVSSDAESSDVESGESECVKCGEKVERQLKKDIPTLCEDCLPSDMGNGEGSTSEEEAEEEEEEGKDDVNEAVEAVATFVSAKVVVSSVCPAPNPDLPPVDQHGWYKNIVYTFVYVY